MAAPNRRHVDGGFSDDDIPPLGGVPQRASADIGGDRSADLPDLPPDEIERRALLLERLREARREIDEALAHVPAEDLERMEREWIEDVDEAIRQRAIQLIRQAS